MVLYMVSSSSFPASSSTFLAFLFQRSSSSPPLLLPRASLLSSAPLSFSTAPSSALPLPYPLSPPSPRSPSSSSSPSTGSSRANLLFHHCESPPVFADLPGPRHYKYPSSFCPWPLASIRVRPSIRLLSSQKEGGRGGRQEAPPFVASVARRNPFGQLDRIASASYVFFLFWNWKDIGQGEKEKEDALSLSSCCRNEKVSSRFSAPRRMLEKRSGARERCSWKIGSICRGQSRVLIGAPYEWTIRTMPPMFPSYGGGWIVSVDRGVTRRGVRGYRRRETSIVAGLRMEKSGGGESWMDDESLRWNFWSHLRFLRLPPVQTCASFFFFPCYVYVVTPRAGNIEFLALVTALGGIDTQGSSNL